MKVYISSKWGLYRKWFFLIISPLGFIGSLYTFWLHFADGIHHQKGDIAGGLLWLFMSVILYYSAIRPSILLVEGNKIILKGIMKEITYNIDEFADYKEMKYWFGYSKFHILFKDGKSYWFECDANLARYNYMNYHSKEEVINELNRKLRKAINTSRSQNS